MRVSNKITKQTCPRGEGGAKAVDVKGDVHGPVPHHITDLRHQGGQGLVPALLRSDHTESLKRQLE